MDTSSSQWGSGCESGWTGYLEPSHPLKQFHEERRSGFDDHPHQSYRSDYDGGEEDLSMVSDASSGPAHNHCDYEEEYQYPSVLKLEKNKAKESTAKHKHSFLDDTASSPAHHNSKSRFGFWQSAHSNKPDSAEKSKSRGRRRG